jgi:hypothetical protein
LNLTLDMLENSSGMTLTINTVPEIRPALLFLPVPPPGEPGSSGFACAGRTRFLVAHLRQRRGRNPD